MFISSLVADALWLKVDDRVMCLPVIFRARTRSYMYSSFPFLVAHTFFRPCVARKFIITPIPLAPVGHTDTHFMQEMHFEVSTFLGFDSGMASAGHWVAHIPQ